MSLFRSREKVTLANGDRLVPGEWYLVTYLVASGGWGGVPSQRTPQQFAGRFEGHEPGRLRMEHREAVFAVISGERIVETSIALGAIVEARAVPGPEEARHGNERPPQARFYERHWIERSADPSAYGGYAETERHVFLHVGFAGTELVRVRGEVGTPGAVNRRSFVSSDAAWQAFEETDEPADFASTWYPPSLAALGADLFRERTPELSDEDARALGLDQRGIPTDFHERGLAEHPDWYVHELPGRRVALVIGDEPGAAPLIVERVAGRAGGPVIDLQRSILRYLDPRDPPAKPLHLEGWYYPSTKHEATLRFDEAIRIGAERYDARPWRERWAAMADLIDALRRLTRGPFEISPLRWGSVGELRRDGYSSTRIVVRDPASAYGAGLYVSEWPPGARERRETRERELAEIEARIAAENEAEERQERYLRGGPKSDYRYLDVSTDGRLEEDGRKRKATLELVIGPSDTFADLAELILEQFAYTDRARYAWVAGYEEPLDGLGTELDEEAPVLSLAPGLRFAMFVSGKPYACRLGRRLTLRELDEMGDRQPPLTLLRRAGQPTRVRWPETYYAPEAVARRAEVERVKREAVRRYRSGGRRRR